MSGLNNKTKPSLLFDGYKLVHSLSYTVELYCCFFIVKIGVCGAKSSFGRSGQSAKVFKSFQNRRTHQK